MSASAYGTFGPRLAYLYRHVQTNGRVTVTHQQFLTLLAAHRTDAAVDVALPAMPQFMMETNAVRTALASRH